MQSIVQHRIRYTNQCRFEIANDLKVANKSLIDYTDKIISDIYELRQRKKDELEEEHLVRDQYMVQNETALKELGEEINILLKNQPDSLHGVLKQYKATTGFIKTLTNGITLPPTNAVDICLDLPKYEKIKQIITE
jgi:hypothetical protein